jgi:agmatinase
MDIDEKQYIHSGKCFFAQQIAGKTDWFDKAIRLMTDDIYLSIDLDVFDPSIMPATGTPEPGGLSWYQTLAFLKQVFRRRNVLGFDIVEFAPIKELRYPDFLVAKLYYKLLSYKFENDR